MRNLFLKLKQDSANLLEEHHQYANSEKAGTAEEALRRRNTVLEGRVGTETENG